MGSGASGYAIHGTSGSMDGGYNGGADRLHSIGENLESLQSRYPYHAGLFGAKGYGRHTRHIFSNDPIAAARDFYERIAYGGEESPIEGKGLKSTMRGGDVVTIRLVSSSDGSPAITIDIKSSNESNGIKSQKIHFMKA